MKTKYYYPSLVELALFVALVAVVGIAFVTALSGHESSRDDLVGSLGEAVVVNEDQRTAIYDTKDEKGQTLSCIIRIVPREAGHSAYTIGWRTCVDQSGETTR